MQIKTFRFVACKNKYTEEKHFKESVDTKEVDETINDFIEENVSRLIDFKVNTVECKYHNNGGYNEVEVLYTIIYE